jgi:hypothetical protein
LGGRAKIPYEDEEFFLKVLLDKFHKKAYIPTSNPRGMRSLSTFGPSMKTWPEVRTFE